MIEKKCRDTACPFWHTCGERCSTAIRGKLTTAIFHSANPRGTVCMACGEKQAARHWKTYLAMTPEQRKARRGTRIKGHIREVGTANPLKRLPLVMDRYTNPKKSDKHLVLLKDIIKAKDVKALVVDFEFVQLKGSGEDFNVVAMQMAAVDFATGKAMISTNINFLPSAWAGRGTSAYLKSVCPPLSHHNPYPPEATVRRCHRLPHTFWSDDYIGSLLVQCPTFIEVAEMLCKVITEHAYTTIIHHGGNPEPQILAGIADLPDTALLNTMVRPPPTINAHARVDAHALTLCSRAGTVPASSQY
jgi:hypothetical protein